MSPARPKISAPWSDEEHDILVDLTNTQLALEAKDGSKVISWSKHWANVSSQLHSAGYSRTSPACLGYWKRTAGAQKANEKAAGPAWEDEEHQILFGMTEEQLELEDSDPSAVMPWAKHWKRVSERLKEQGYNRSVDACDAYWNLVQDKSADTSESGVDGEGESSDDVDEASGPSGPSEANGGVDAPEINQTVVEEDPEPPSQGASEKAPVQPEASEVEKEPEPPSNAQVESPPAQRTPRRKSMIPPEYIDRINDMIRVEGDDPKSHNKDILLSKYDISRGIYAQWLRERRPNEDVRISPRQSLPTRWSSVNVQPEIPVTLESPSVEVTRTATPKDDNSQPQINIPEVMVNGSEETSTKKTKTTAFRFSPDQRAFLEEEAARNGSNPGQDRRLELASQLRVEEKTVRNWFVHHRQRSTRRSLDNRPRVESPYANDYFLATAAVKRSQDSIGGNDAVEVIPQGEEVTLGYAHQSKKPRLEDVLTPDPSSHARIAIPTSEPINIIRKVAPREWPDIPLTRSPRSSAAPPGTGEAPRSQPPVETYYSGRRSSSSPRSVARSAFQALQNPTFRVDPRKSMEAEFPQPTSTPLPPTNIQKCYTSGKIANEYEPATPVSWTAVPSEASRTPQNSIYSNRTTTQSLESDFKTPQTSTTPQAAEMTPITDETEKAWLSSKVNKLQADIMILRQDDHRRITRIRSIEHEIDEVKKQDGRLHQLKAEEIARVLRDIEDRYQRDHDVLHQRQAQLGNEKEDEEAALRRNAKQISRNEVKMKSYQTLVELDDDVDDSG